jgi:hypothetical protein
MLTGATIGLIMAIGRGERPGLLVAKRPEIEWKGIGNMTLTPEAKTAAEAFKLNPTEETHDRLWELIKPIMTDENDDWNNELFDALGRTAYSLFLDMP